MFNTKTLGVVLSILIIIFVISVYRRPSKDSIFVSFLETKAEKERRDAKKLQEEATRALESCKQRGVDIPEQLFSLVKNYRERGTYGTPTSVVENFTSGFFTLDLKKTVQDILDIKAPTTLPPPQIKELEKAKLDVAKAVVADAQAKASTLTAELAREQITAPTATILQVPVTETVKQNPDVKLAATKVEETAKKAEEAAEQAEKMTEKAAQVASNLSSKTTQIAEVQKEADMIVAKAAVAAADAAQAKLNLATTISKLDSSPAVQDVIKPIVEAEKKAAEVASSVAVAAEAKAEVSKAQAKVTESNEKIDDTKPIQAQQSAMDEKLKAEEELRKKVAANEIAVAEAQRKQAEELAKQLAAEEKKRRDEQERQAYVGKILNQLLQRGLIQANDETFFAISQAKSIAEIDSIAEKITMLVTQRREKEAEDEKRLNRRLQELSDVKQNRQYLTIEQEQAILLLPDEAEFQRKKAELKALTEQRIKSEEEERQKKIDEENRISNERSKARLAELMAMTPEVRAQSQLDETKKREESIKGGIQGNFEAYKKRVLANLTNIERVVPNDVAETLMKLTTYDEFDKQMKAERIKRETAAQRLRREAEEAKFIAYKDDEIKTLLQNDLIFNDEATLSKLRNTTNYDQYTDLAQIELARKKQAYFAEQVKDATAAQTKAMFAQNMEPTRKILVEAAYKDGWITKAQYDLLLVTSINTSEKFQAIQDEIKKSKDAIVAAREAETKRKIAEAEAAQKAREEEERLRKEEERKQVLETFNKNRIIEVENLKKGMFAITEAQAQDLLTTPYEEYNAKKEKYILDAYGGTPKPGESLADFFNRRQSEKITERALVEQKKKDDEQNASRVQQLFQRNQDMVNSTNRFWKAEGEANLKILNALKARNLGNTEFLKAWENATISDAERKQREDERKFDETQQKKFTIKDKDGNDITFYRFFKYSMPAGYRITGRTAEECVRDLADNPNVVGFLRDNNVKVEDKADCWVNDKTDMRFAKPTTSGINIFVRYDQLSKVVGAESVVGPEEMAAAAALTELNTKKRAEAEAKKVEEANKAKLKALLDRSELLTIGGKQFRVFKNSLLPRYGDKNVQIGAAVSATLEDAVNKMNSINGKSFGRITWGNVLNADQSAWVPVKNNLVIPRSTAHIFSTSDPYLIYQEEDQWGNSPPQYAIYIPVENLPAEFKQTSGFADYSRGSINKKSIVNQGGYLNRAQRSLDYTMFHPAL